MPTSVEGLLGSLLTPSLYDYLTTDRSPKIDFSRVGKIPSPDPQLDPRLLGGLSEVAGLAALPFPGGVVNRFGQGLKQVGGRLGSNPGGVFLGPSGQRFYVKTPASEDLLRNELLASELYKRSGVETPQLMVLESPSGKHSIVSPWEEGTLLNRTKSPDVRGIQRGFPADAWLANWDVIGLNKDNIVMTPRGPVRIDLGGSMRYRAMGGPKEFGENVGELKSLPQHQPEFFGNMPNEALRPTAKRIGEIPSSELKYLSDQLGPLKGPNRLYDVLEKRRESILKYLGL